jgi:hypothetical protein
MKIVPSALAPWPDKSHEFPTKEVTMSSRACTTIGLSPLLAGLIGCGTEKIEANVLFLSNGGVAAAELDTYFTVVFAPNNTTPVEDGTQYHMRIDGQWVLESRENPVYLPLQPMTATNWPADNLAPGDHALEVVDPSGKVVLVTAPLALTPQRGNQILVYGNRDQLQYRFLTYPTADLEAIPTDQVLVRVMNLRVDMQSVDISSCPTVTATFSPADCTIARRDLAYGEMWQQLLPRTTQISAQGILWDSDVACLADPPRGVSLVTPEIITYLPVTSNGFFILNDLSGSPTCTSSKSLQ